MNLQERLEAIKQQGMTRIPAEALAVMGRATEELQNSGIAERALKSGDQAPDFSLNNTRGEAVALKSLLKQGPVVLSFYRGKW